MHDEQPNFPPGYIERFERTASAAGASNVSPLPGPLLDAWLPTTLTAAGLKLRPVVAADWAILARIESPILKELMAMGKGETDAQADAKSDVSYSDEQIWELVFLWTRSPREARAALANGLPAWREAVMQATADVLPAGVIKDKAAIMTALGTNLSRALATTVGYESPHAPGEQVNFTPPPAARTVSAGG